MAGPRRVTPLHLTLLTTTIAAAVFRTADAGMSGPANRLSFLVMAGSAIALVILGVRDRRRPTDPPR